ncbi:iron-containing alcohol dehydrogenase [Ruminiclostridium papyrosolvens DSM 2782]|uniref:Iron-containing alcohol dehydrogenase n=1 Tax=Ruminiclostridium papyrosolvens DSM 2782 TaxID=588581 RepID=F1TB74_9FIRM|nr:iron-containing alcohol dehydrogenase [Ruminiclostridium papyrosolvens]EGD48278.1 iron-containing alcohol dehydrogenase [Ruminiclostridium papyrosolvens DSM 2782]WES36658.1 iron-containing alcohol dehydrogenase [Ruminiclostridium papyrosolvens DSM 2782]
MLNFDMHLPTRIIFGKDTQKEIGSLIKPYTKKALLHYGGNSIKKSGLYNQVVSSLKENNIEFVELGGVVPNPRLSMAEEGAELCKKEGVDLILAVGGGSVIDSAKAIAIGACNDDIWKFYEEGGEIKAALPVATILTIPAAGSESSPHTVITNEEKQIKKGYGSNYLKPVISIVNPELFFTLPKNQIANGVADMMSHIFERYFTNTTDTDLTDGLCETTLKTIMKNALIVSQNPENYDAWCQVGFGGTIAHNDILGLGRAQDWACHDMEHELSAIYDIAHGAGLAILTPAWMQYVYKTNINMFVQFAVNVMGVEGSYRAPDAIVTEGISRLREFYKKMGLPATLTEIGIEESKFELMAKKATGEAYGKEHSIGGLKKLNWQDVQEIYKLAK